MVFAKTGDGGSCALTSGRRSTGFDPAACAAPAQETAAARGCRGQRHDRAGVEAVGAELAALDLRAGAADRSAAAPCPGDDEAVRRHRRRRSLYRAVDVEYAVPAEVEPPVGARTRGGAPPAPAAPSARGCAARTTAAAPATRGAAPEVADARAPMSTQMPRFVEDEETSGVVDRRHAHRVGAAARPRVEVRIARAVVHHGGVTTAPCGDRRGDRALHLPGRARADREPPAQVDHAGAVLRRPADPSGDQALLSTSRGRPSIRTGRIRHPPHVARRRSRRRCRARRVHACRPSRRRRCSRRRGRGRGGRRRSRRRRPRPAQIARRGRARQGEESRRAATSAVRTSDTTSKRREKAVGRRWRSRSSRCRPPRSPTSTGTSTRSTQCSPTRGSGRRQRRRPR